MYRIALLAVVLAPLSCTNVNQMHKLYQEGDHAQLDRIMEIVSRQDYPYATRRKAARILGEIGDPRAVPVLKMALQDYDQRTTLKQDALRALGTIGDQSAALDIGRLLNYSLNTADSELRMAAIEALGQMGGLRRLKFWSMPSITTTCLPCALSSEPPGGCSPARRSLPIPTDGCIPTPRTARDAIRMWDWTPLGRGASLG